MNKVFVSLCLAFVSLLAPLVLFPQATSTWPESRRAIARAFEDIPEEVRRQVLVDNAAKLYHLS